MRKCLDPPPWLPETFRSGRARPPSSALAPRPSWRLLASGRSPTWQALRSLTGASGRHCDRPDLALRAPRRTVGFAQTEQPAHRARTTAMPIHRSCPQTSPSGPQIAEAAVW